MKLLFVSNLFPNGLQLTRGMFNKQMIVKLAELCDVKVIAPVPWYLKLRVLANTSKRTLLSRIPENEVIEGIKVFHPRYLVIPKFARSLYGFLLFASLIRIRQIQKIACYDIIFASWAYPDAFAAALLSIFMKKPLVVKVHGTDINEFTKYRLRRKMIVFALKKARKIVSVSGALKSKMVALGIPKAKIKVIQNGIDKSKFRPMDKIQTRQKLGLPVNKKIILFVGNLVLVKGLDYLLDALSFIKKKNHLGDILLILVGDGILRESLQNRVRELNLEEFVRFVGIKPHDEIPLWVNACDLFCLPSLNEGCPNVILEALACGKPVVASNVGGIPEIISDDNLGILTSPGDSAELAEAILKALQKDWNRELLIKSRNSWKEVAEKTMEELKNSVNLR